MTVALIVVLSGLAVYLAHMALTFDLPTFRSDREDGAQL